MADALTYSVLRSRALIALSGPDWRDFLHGLITQDVETMAPGDIRFGALLTPQGRLLYDLFVVENANGAWLDVEAEHRAAIMQRLAIYRLRAKVDIVAADGAVGVVFLEPSPPCGERVGSGGAGAEPEVLMNGTAREPSELGANTPTPDPSPQEGGGTEVAGHLADPRLPELGWRRYDAAVPSRAILSDEAAYDAHRLALGVPGPADWGSDKTYPIEANFDLLNGIDFKKGCFVGQETTSRMKRRGQIKTRMLPITFEGPTLASGSEVLNGDLRAGTVLSGGEGRAMASLRLDRLGGSLTAEDRQVAVDRPSWLVAGLGEDAEKPQD